MSLMKNKTPYLIWLICSSYFLFDYINQVAPSSMVSSLHHDFTMNDACLGTLAAVYFYIYAILQIPAGMIVDRFEAKKPIIIAAIIAITGCILFSRSHTTTTLFIARLMIGCGAAFSFVCCLKIIANWFKPALFASLSGITNMMGMIGALTAQIIITDLVVHLHWRMTMLVIALTGCFSVLLILFFLKDKPKHMTQVSAESLKDSWNHLKIIIKSHAFWLAGIYAATINTAFSAIGALWGITYIQNTYHTSALKSASVSSFLFIGGIAGSFLVGIISDRLKRRKSPMIISALVSLLLVCLILYSHVSLSFMPVAMFLLGFFASANMLSYAYGNDIKPAGASGISVGFINTWLIGGSAISQPITGLIIDLSQASKALSPHTTYVYGLSFITLCMVIAIICACFLKETYGREVPVSIKH